MSPSQLNKLVQSRQQKTRPYLLIIPGIFDIGEHIFRNVSIALISPSINQMLRSSVVVFAALLLVFFLKGKLYRHHWLSIGCIVAGLVFVGLAAKSGKEHSASQIALGICLQLVGQLSGAISYTAEEKLMSDCDELDPTLLIGWEGFWAAAIYMILLPIFQFVPCTNNDICTGRVIEDTYLVFQDYGANYMLILQSLALGTLTLIINIAGVTITKIGSASQRTVVDQMRNLTVWAYFIVVPINGAYLDKFTVMQASGFTILLMGVLVYNEIIVLPCLGFNQYTREKLEQRKVSQKQIKIAYERQVSHDLNYSF
ncbi:hypothetical protein FGO68_gene7334 [Halteria grandinella]|uniref:EamA domain-containing protein n=1 Tax=Halteria grandinella TaxID=5974 RepID=A0A8J8T0V8_HALGN|nr:hypothetical protein FGO68_gene7334 [Halteria grandinella]